MNIQNNNMKPATSKYYVWHPIISNSTLLTADTNLLCTKTLYPIYGSHSPFHTKCVFPCWCGATVPPIWPPALPLHLDSSLETAIREPTLYKLLMFNFPNFMSIFLGLSYGLQLEVSCEYIE
jgi:hypothetical protein